MSAWFALWLWAAPAFARIDPFASNTLLFRGSCAHALDAWAASSARVREMQRWFQAYMRDPGPAVTPRERLANAYLELHDEAVDRLKDLSKSSRDFYARALAKTGLSEGRVPDRRGAERFIFILNSMQLLLRERDTLDLGAAPGAALMLAVVTGVLDPESVVIDFFDAADLSSSDSFIEPPDWLAFTTVEDTLAELRRARAVAPLRDAFVPEYRFRREALLQTIDNLRRRREWPERVREGLRDLRDLRMDYFADAGHQSVTFGRMVGVLKELEDFAKIGATMDAVSLSTLEDD